MKPAIFHRQALATIRAFPGDVRRELGKPIYDLQLESAWACPLAVNACGRGRGEGSCSMNKKSVTRTAGELAKARGLPPADGAEFGLRSEVNTKIVEQVRRRGLTHAEVARLAQTSRTRVTAIVNRNTKDISTDLLLRVLYALGWTANVRFRRAA